MIKVTELFARSPNTPCFLTAIFPHSAPSAWKVTFPSTYQTSMSNPTYLFQEAFAEYCSSPPSTPVAVGSGYWVTDNHMCPGLSSCWPVGS